MILVKKALSCILLLMLTIGMIGSAAATYEPKEGVSGHIVFKYWGTEQQAVMEQIANDFMAVNGNITVEVVNEPGDQFWTKLIASIAAGVPTADVAWMNPTYAKQMIGTGQLADISDLYESGRIDKANFTEAAIGSYTSRDGGIYAVPKDFQTVCLIYNKAIFDEVGIPYPTDDWTWDDLLKASQAIVKKDASGPGYKYGIILTRIGVIATTFIGSVSSVDVVWNFGSAAVGAMAWFNIIVIVLLSKPGIATLKDYEAQKKLGLDPVFVPKRCGIEGAELWDKIVPEHYAKELAALKAAEKGK